MRSIYDLSSLCDTRVEFTITPYVMLITEDMFLSLSVLFRQPQQERCLILRWSCILGLLSFVGSIVRSPVARGTGIISKTLRAQALCFCRLLANRYCDISTGSPVHPAIALATSLLASSNPLLNSPLLCFSFTS
jgi:hypothetical protein